MRATAKEQLELSIRAKAGDREAAGLLVEAVMGFVVRVARGYRGRGLEDEDLCQEGVLGVLRAIDRFDPARGYRFLTYAAWWIRQGIRRAVEGGGSLVRVPHNAHGLDRALANGTIEQTDALLERMRDVERALKAPRHVHRSRRGGGSAGGAFDDLEDERAPDPVEVAELTLLLEVLARDMTLLTKRERRVLELRHGIGGRTRTLGEIGRTFGLTRERIRQVELRAIERLGGEP